MTGCFLPMGLVFRTGKRLKAGRPKTVLADRGILDCFKSCFLSAKCCIFEGAGSKRVVYGHYYQFGID